MTDEEPKKETIRLSIVDTDGNGVEYEIKRHIPLSKLFTKYCDLKKKNPGSLVMTHRNVPVDLHMSSEALELEDGAELNIVGRQVGG